MNSLTDRFLKVIAVAMVCTGILRGQTAVTAAITGSVTDPSVAAISEAKIDIANSATCVVDETVTNSAGVYRLQV